jgi:CDP-glucose 4,6-dehydratase
MVVQSWNVSFFADSTCPIASARAGNTIGGGDWAEDRLVPDIVRAAQQRQDVSLRHPDAVRPWQHVLDPVAGYALLAEKLWRGSGGSAYNFGPPASDRVTVGELAGQLVERLGQGTKVRVTQGTFAESAVLVLDSSLASAELGWKPRLDMQAAIRLTAEWYSAYLRREDMGKHTRSQVVEYCDADT